MALRALSSSAGDTTNDQDLSDQLDADIARVRAEIESLKKRKHLLTFSLLSSTKVQSQLNHGSKDSPTSYVTDPSPVQVQAQHNDINIHRLAYGVTAFPFTDPNPDTSDRPLLGVRFDIPSRNGRFEKAPYYIFFKRAREDAPYGETPNTTARLPTSGDDDDLKIHHHTIPALVPLQDYEARYLPQSTLVSSRNSHRRHEDRSSPSRTTGDPDNSDNDIAMLDHNGDTQQKPVQDLHALVAAVRRDLTSWQLRQDSITLLSERLNLTTTPSSSSTRSSPPAPDKAPKPRFSVQTCQATAADARFCRLVWENGTVGRLRLTDDGHIDRAVVIGISTTPRQDQTIKPQPDRMRDVERLLCSDEGNSRGGGARLPIERLLERLEEVERKMNPSSQGRQQDEDNDDDNDTNMEVE